MNKNKLLLIGAALLLLMPGCKGDVTDNQKGAEEPQVISQQSGISGTVTETMDASGYTYVLVDTGGENIWVAGQKVVVKVGDEVFVPGGSPMANFESKTLGRTFEQIIFASSIMVGGADQPFAADQAPADRAQAATPQAVVDFSGLTKPDGGKTVEEVISERIALNTKSVKVRAKVVKFMSGIMGKNWLHLKDGTGAPGADDLVVTTDANVKVGDTVLVTGAVAADRDFGSGYSYEVIIEDAEVVVE